MITLPRVCALMVAAQALLLASGAFSQTNAPAPAQPAAPSEQATNAPPPDAAVAEAKAASDWPCVQRKVMTLTSTQIWDGPPVEELSGWESDAEIQRLIPILASRRVPEEEAAKEIKKYAESLPEAERDQKLTLLFAGLLSEINRNRTAVVNGIETFQKRQRLRATELEREGVEIAALKDKNLSEEEMTKATELYNWNARIFQERQRNIPLACEIPVLIEQRIFALGREIRTHMKG